MGKHSWGEGELFHYKMKLKKNTQMMFIIFIILKTTTLCEKSCESLFNYFEGTLVQDRVQEVKRVALARETLVTLF